MTSLRSEWTIVDGTRIHARVSQRQHDRGLPVVVLVHGLSVSSRYLVRLGDRLAGDHEVLVPDLPGFGLSDKPSSALDMPALAAVLERWLDARGAGRVVLAGHSLGCQIAIRMAARSPERVGALALLAPTVDPAARSITGQAARLLRDAVREPIPLVAIQLRDYLRTGLRRSLQTLRFAVADEPERQLAQLRMPALVVSGGRDPIVSPTWAATVARLLPDGRLATIEGAAHAMPYSAPERCAALIRELVIGVASRRL
ncbi:MAG: alpha/beta fold hydrolase [Gemmatimonadaceae bacterium]